MFKFQILDPSCLERRPNQSGTTKALEDFLIIFPSDYEDLDFPKV